MIEQEKKAEKIGKASGFIFSYLLFTAILVFVLTTMNKIPNSSYLHIMAITFLITLTGTFLKRILNNPQLKLGEFANENAMARLCRLHDTSLVSSGAEFQRTRKEFFRLAFKMKLFFKGFKKGIREFGSCVGIVINTVLLSIVYLLGIGVTTILAKIMRKRFLETEFSKNNKNSYWSDLNMKRRPKKEYYRQF